VRKSSGALHYFINGTDQGVATTRTPQPIWGVVDLYGMAVQVTIVDVDGDAGGCQPSPDNSVTNDVTQQQTNSVAVDTRELTIHTEFCVDQEL